MNPARSEYWEASEQIAPSRHIYHIPWFQVPNSSLSLSRPYPITLRRKTIIHDVKDRNYERKGHDLLFTRSLTLSRDSPLFSHSKNENKNKLDGHVAQTRSTVDRPSVRKIGLSKSRRQTFTRRLTIEILVELVPSSLTMGDRPASPYHPRPPPLPHVSSLFFPLTW